MKKMLLSGPDFDQEDKASKQGYELIAGVDEAGRGPLAGPVVAAAVVLPRPMCSPWLGMVRDSKEITAGKRDILFDLINKESLAVGVGIISHTIIDSMNILKATHLAMKQAVDNLSLCPQFLLIDGLILPECAISQKGIIRGDKLSLSVACASIVAKVTRDRIMVDMDKMYPGYGFARHKGYGTREHLDCLNRLGSLPIHRLSFAPVRKAARVHHED